MIAGVRCRQFPLSFAMNACTVDEKEPVGAGLEPCYSRLLLI